MSKRLSNTIRRLGFSVTLSSLNLRRGRPLTEKDFTSGDACSAAASEDDKEPEADDGEDHDGSGGSGYDGADSNADE